MTMSRGAVDAAADTRKCIVEAAYTLFVRNGYHGTSMRMIADEAGLRSVAGIYNHFVSKERVFAQVVEAYHPLVRTLEPTEAARGRTQQGIVKSLAKHMIQSLLEDPGMFNLMLIEFVEHDGVHIDELRGVFMPQLVQMAKRVRAKKGRLRRMNPDILIQSLLGFVFSRVFFGWVFGDSEGVNRKDLGKHIDLYLNGVLKRKRK
jgi:AcrR family transcriptional regulator